MNFLREEKKEKYEKIKKPFGYYSFIVKTASDIQRRQISDVFLDRVFWLSVIFISMFIIIGARVLILALGLFSGTSSIHHYSTRAEYFFFPLTNIIDRNGSVLATDMPTESVYVNPYDVRSTQVDQEARDLHKILGIHKTKLTKKLTSKKKFVWIARYLSFKTTRKIRQLNYKNLGFLAQTKRAYPNASLTAHVVGMVNMDGNGISGMEYYLSQANKLKKILYTGDINKNNLHPLKLSIDLQIQYIVRNELMKGMKKYQTKNAVGIVMNVHTGEILAMVSLPDFDPNNYKHVTSNEKFNRATLGDYEMGSIMKAITFASALNSGSLKLTQVFDVSHPILIDGYTIHDYRGHDAPAKILTAENVLVKSSNIGTAKIALAMGSSTLKKYYKKLGLLSKTHIEIPARGYPLFPKKWGKVELITIAFGHGIAVSPLQALVAFSTIINGGIKVLPTLLYVDPRMQQRKRKKEKRVFSSAVSYKMQELLRDVVTEGTGRHANLQSYHIIGKTGTAEKVINGRYSRKKNITSFVSAFPSHNPRYAMIIMYDEPHPTKKTYGFTTAAWNAAPVTAAIIKRIAPILGINPTSK